MFLHYFINKTLADLIITFIIQTIKEIRNFARHYGKL